MNQILRGEQMKGIAAIFLQLLGFCFEVLTCHHVIRDCIKQNDRLGRNGGCGSGIAVTCDEAVCQLGERIISSFCLD